MRGAGASAGNRRRSRRETSGASHECDDVGTVAYRVVVEDSGEETGVTSSATSSANPLPSTPPRPLSAANFHPGTFRAEGGSVVAVAFGRGYAASTGGPSCVFVGDAGGVGGETNVVAMTMTRARVVSAAVWTCEAPRRPRDDETRQDSPEDPSTGWCRRRLVLLVFPRVHLHVILLVHSVPLLHVLLLDAR